jgi:hypothetical protein
MQSPWGRIMSDFIWYWTKGKTTFYTRNTSEAEKMMKNGYLVFGKKLKPSFLKF